MARHNFPYNFFASIKRNVWRKKMIKINTIVLNPFTFNTMIIININKIYSDEKPENFIHIIFWAIPKIIAGI